MKALSGWEFMKECSKIPKDHDIILRSISEHGDVDLKFMQYSYIYTHDDDKQKFIDILRRGLEHIKNDDFESLFDMETE